MDGWMDKEVKVNVHDEIILSHKKKNDTQKKSSDLWQHEWNMEVLY